MSQTALPNSVTPDSAHPDSAHPDGADSNAASTGAAALREQVASTIRLLLPRVLGREVPAVREDAPLFEEVGLDSATTLELILELEDELVAQVDVEQISQDDLVTLGALVDFLAGHVVPE
jgi:acyl carrier protein